MKKFTLRLLSMLMLLTVCCVGWASELTVNDGTGNNDYVPVYGLYVDNYIHTQIIYPAASLANMTGEEIHSMKFYLKSSASASWGAANFEIRLSEVSVASFSSAAWNTENEGTLVYSGELDGTGEEMDVVFTTDYTYNGGNLLFDLVSTAKGSWKSASFYGVSTTGASVSGYSSTSAASASATDRSFLPKTTFDYGAPPACPKPTGLLVEPLGLSASLSWTSEATSFDIAYATSASADPNANIVQSGVTQNPCQVSSLTINTDYYFWVRANCGDDGISEWAGPVSAHIGYCTPNPSSRDGKGITKVVFGSGDYIVNNVEETNGLPATSPYYGDYSSLVGALQAGVESTVSITYATGSYTVYSYGTIIWVDWNNSLTFEDDEIVYTGTSPEGSSGTPQVLDASFTIPAGQPVGNYRMRIAGADSYFDSYIGGTHTANHSACFSSTYAVCHDYTIRVLEAPSCLPPSTLAADNITPTSAVLSWTAESNESEWKLYYKKSDVTEFTEVTVSDNPHTLNGLTPASSYQFYVKAVCSGSEESEASSVASFVTGCVAITSFPWSEDFEAYAAGNFEAPCWVNEHISGDGSYIFKITTSTNGSNKTHQLQLPDQDLGTLTKLMLPEMNLPNANYQFVFDIYRSNITYSLEDNPYEGIRVFVSTNGQIEGATELAFIPRQYNEANGSIPAESAAGWYSYELPLGVSGNCNIILRGENRYCSSTYMDNFIVEQIPTCKKPSALMLETPSSRTAHTATLKWTKGEESQSAWEIAYSKLANFNPDEQITDSIASADSNPFTLSGLEQSTTYYAYVRANCGAEDGKSVWSSNKASFTTLSGHQALSNLALVDGSLGSQGAEVNWKPNAYNELHASYEIYYSKLSTLPATEEALSIDSLIQNISDTFYVFSDLDPETQYYVWVRDNCAADGLSAWSSRASFTTLANCAVPFNLAASEVSAHEATIAWEGNNDSYSVQYRTAAYAEGIEETFGTSIPSGWSMYTGLLNDDGTATLSEATYVWSFGTSNGVFDNHARVNIYGNNQRWLVMPIMAIEDGFIISFDLALTAFSGTLANPATTGTDDKFIVLISTDNKAKWTTLRQWDNADSKDVYNNIACSATGQHISIDLSAYSGQNAYIAFYGESTASNADNNLHIDNVLVGINHDAGQWQSVSSNVKSKQISGLAPETKYDVQVLGICGAITTDPSEIISFTTTPSCLPVSNLAVSDITASGASFSWADNSTQTQWQYACVAKDDDPVWSNENIVSAAASASVSGLNANSSYDFYVRAYCGSEDQSEAIKLNFCTECAAVSTLPWNEDFEGMDADIVPLCWDNSASTSSTITNNPERIWGVYENSDNKMLRMYNFYVQSGTAIINSPIIELPSDKPCVFEFDYSHTASCGNFDVKISSDGGNTFTSLKSYAKTSTGTSYTDPGTFIHAKINLAAYAGQSVILQFFANANYGQGAIFIDNVKVKAAETWSVIVNASRYATFYSDEAAYVMPQGLIGYAFTIDEHLSDPFYGAEGGLAPIVPAGTPLVLEGDAGTYSLVPSLAAGTELTLDNDLFGVNDTSIVGSASDGNVYYVLSLAAGAEPDYNSVGFYYMLEEGKGGFELPAHKAYLVVDNPSLAPSAFFLIDENQNATWLNSLEGVEGIVKFLHEGNIYILRDSIIYDATGRKVRELK